MDNGACSYRRFLDGDEKAFDSIMEELYHGLVFFINGYVHDIHAAEDIAIDTLSDLVVHRHRYNFKVSLKTYLYMIGRSRALNYIKHRKVIDFVDLPEAGGIAEDEAELEKIVLADERRRQVNAAVEQLPVDMREAVRLVYFEDMSHAEAAAVMKKNRKQVDNLIYRAKKELSVILGKEWET